MKVYNMRQMQRRVKRELSPKRYEHTMGVMYTAAALAMCHGYDIKAAQVAGLLHDCAKNIDDEKKLMMCEKYNITITETERKNPFLLHAKLGAFLAMHKYNISDMEIINAILNHTTAKPAMSTLDKIIYVADYIEPLRDKAPNLHNIRKIAYEDLDRCVYMILKDTLSYLEARGGEIDPITIKACRYYEEKYKDAAAAEQAEAKMETDENNQYEE